MPYTAAGSPLSPPAVRLPLVPLKAVEWEADEPDDMLTSLPSARGAMSPRSAVGEGCSDTHAFFMMLKAMVGSGVLFLPRAFADSGVLFAAAAEVVVAVLTALCIVLLVRALPRGAESVSFEEVGRAAYGPIAAAGVRGSIFFFQLGLVVMYFIFVADTVHSTVAGAFGCAGFLSELRAEAVVAAVAAMQVPVALVRSIGRLSVLAIVADICIVIGLSAVLCAAVTNVGEHGVQHVPAVRTSGIGLFIGTSVLAFEGIGVMLPVASTMRHPENFTRLLCTATAGCCVLYLVVGVAGAAAYGESVRPNVLLSLDPSSGAAVTGSMLYAVGVAATLPLQAFPAYLAFESAVGAKGCRSSVSRVALLALLAVCAVSWRREVRYLVAVVGGLAGVPLSFVYPALFHYRLSRDRGESTPVSELRDLGIAAGGVCAAVYVTAVSVADWTSTAMAAPDTDQVCAHVLIAR